MIRVIRNGNVPVNRLPPEVLSRILEYRTCERDLVATTHVCQHWRSTLISSSSLWNSFQFKSHHDLDRTLTYLQRSKLVPIDISIDINFSQDLEVLTHFAPHITRTRSLVIQGFHVHAISLFCNPVPSLEYLENHEDSLHIPNNFLGQQAPSLRFVSFRGIYPTFETLFPLPSLTEFDLYLPKDVGPLRMSVLFRLFSDSPLLQKICINTPNQVTQDIPLDQIISLESLVELDYFYNSGDRILPHLKLPRLKQLRVSSSLEPGQIQRLAHILPYDGHVLLAGATKMLCHSRGYTIRIDLSGDDGLDVSLSANCTTEDRPSVDWFSDQTCIPFGQIEDLEVECFSIDVYFPNVFALENLGILRIVPWEPQFSQELLRLLYPDPGAGVPCRSLREIECVYRGDVGPHLRLLISLAMERKRAGHRLELVRLELVQESLRHSVEELREHVGEVRVERWLQRT